MNHEIVLDGEDSILSGGSSILVDGGLPAERFNNSTASYERREKRKAHAKQKKIRPSEHKFERGQTRATTAPESSSFSPAYSVFLPTIGVEVTASGGRFSVTQRRSPDRRVWRERKSVRPRTTIGPMMSEPSVEDLDGFDKDYGDRPTPIITASPKQIVRIRPIDVDHVGDRTVRGGGPHKGRGGDGGGGGGGGSGNDSVGNGNQTLAAYFEQQGPRSENVVWAGDGGHHPGTGIGKSLTPNVRNAPFTAPASKGNRNRNRNINRNANNRTTTTASVDNEFDEVQRQSPYWAPKPKPKYVAYRVKTAEAGRRRRKDSTISGGSSSVLGDEEDGISDIDYDERRQYLKTPDINTVVSRESYLSRESLKSLLSDSVISLTREIDGDSDRGNDGGGSRVGSGRGVRRNGKLRGISSSKKRRKQTTLKRPRTVQAYMSGILQHNNSPTTRAKTASTATRRSMSTASQRFKSRPGTATSVTSDKSDEYTSCAACHRQRSKFSDFCNVCLRKMSQRRKSNKSEQRAVWSREGKSATFLLELSGTSDDNNNSNNKSSSSFASNQGHTNQQAAMDIAITRLTFNEATSTNKLLREARLDAVAAAKKRGAGSLHGWLDALAMSSEANHAIKKVQSVFRGFYFRYRFHRGRWSILRLQSWHWGIKSRKRVSILRTRWYAAIQIQRIMRGVSTRTYWNLEVMVPAAIKIQTNFRGYLGRMELKRLKYLEILKIKNANGWRIQCAYRQRIARNIYNYKISLKNGAIGLTKTWRMYIIRKWFLKHRRASIILQNRLIRRRLSQNLAHRLRAVRDAELRALRKVQDRAITKVQRIGRVWLALRRVDRLREKYDEAMEAIELGKERYDEVSAAGEWPTENQYVEYTLHLQFLRKDITEASRAYRAGIGRHSGNDSGAALLNYGYALLLALRRNEQQNDLDESKRKN
jgi:hypothetical protein